MRWPSQLSCDQNGQDRYLCLEADVDDPVGYNWSVAGLASSDGFTVDPYGTGNNAIAIVDCSSMLRDGNPADYYEVDVTVWMWRKLSDTYPIGPKDSAGMDCHGAPANYTIEQMAFYSPTYYDVMYELELGYCTAEWYAVLCGATIYTYVPG
jgi:hypothetical protein